jgi:hypothetical protein
MRTTTTRVDEFGDRIATLLRQGSGKQYDEVRAFVLDALHSADPIRAEMVIEIIWSLLPKRAQSRIRREQRAEPPPPPDEVAAHSVLGGHWLRRVLREELSLSEAIVRDGYDVIPRFRIFAPEGQFVILLQISDDADDRRRRMDLIERFLAWKMATSFVVSGEAHRSDRLSAFAVTPGECYGRTRRIEGKAPLTLGPLRRLGAADVAPEFLAMLPRRETIMSVEMVAELERTFGKEGEMPATRVG